MLSSSLRGCRCDADKKERKEYSGDHLANISIGNWILDWLHERPCFHMQYMTRARGGIQLVCGRAFILRMRDVIAC